MRFKSFKLNLTRELYSDLFHQIYDFPQYFKNLNDVSFKKRPLTTVRYRICLDEKKLQNFIFAKRNIPLIRKIIEYESTPTFPDSDEQSYEEDEFYGKVNDKISFLMGDIFPLFQLLRDDFEILDIFRKRWITIIQKMDDRRKKRIPTPYLDFANKRRIELKSDPKIDPSEIADIIAREWMERD